MLLPDALRVDLREAVGQAAAMNWIEIKIGLESASGLDRDALHIYGAIIIQLFFALFFRRSLASPWPWLFVISAELANEYFDNYASLSTTGHITDAGLTESIKDIWNTMILPTFLLLAANFAPSWLVGRPKREPQTQVEGDDVLKL